MPRSRTRRFTLKHALGLSTVLHALLAPLFVVSGVLVLGAGNSFDPTGLRSDDRVSIATVTVVRHVRAKPAALPRDRASARTPVALRPRAKIAKQTHAFVRGGEDAPAASTAIAARTPPTSTAPRSALVAPAQTPAPQPSEAPPSVQPTTAAVALTSAVEPPARSGIDAPVGGWGQSFEHPLIADDGALSDLRAKYHFAAAITISVDENGRAVKVNVPASVPTDARDEIQKRLAALRYIPAECNGLRCAALLSITI